MLRLIPASRKWLLGLAFLGLLGCGGGNASQAGRQSQEPTVQVEGGQIGAEKLQKSPVDSSPQSADRESPPTNSR